MHSIEFVDALRASAKDMHAIFEILERRDATSQGRNRRSYERFSYRVPNGIRLIINPDSGPTNKLRVWPRNISAGGCSFLHGSLLYIGTPCTMILESLDGEPISVDGSIVRCDHICARFHEVGVVFKEAVDVTFFAQRDSLSVPKNAAPPPPRDSTIGIVHSTLMEIRRLLDEPASRDEVIRRMDELIASLRAA